MMKIGITERGDAGIDFSWIDKLNSVDGAILITKNANPTFIRHVLNAYKTQPNIVIHINCTGWGDTWLEPNVPDFNTQLYAIQKLIDGGFPPSHIVLRIDPIIPTPDGIAKAKAVIDKFLSMNTGVTRIRFSVLDEYNHVKDRLTSIGHKPFYEGFLPSTEMLNCVAQLLNSYPQLTFESCAEHVLATKFNVKNIKEVGCVSTKELELFGIDIPSTLTENGQNRFGCHCLTCKTELLTNRRQCPHKCVYCYWKPNN